MLPHLPQDILISILDAIEDDGQYHSGDISDVWSLRRLSTLRNVSLACHMLSALARPRLFAHIDFDARGNVQSRASRLLQYFVPNEGIIDASDPGGKVSQHRLHSLRSFKFRDGYGTIKPEKTTPRWETDKSTSLGCLLALFLTAPQLRMFAFEGDSWTLAGAGQLPGHQDYISRMSYKPSLRVLSLTNVYDLPFDILLGPQPQPRPSGVGIRSLRLSSVSFVDTKGVCAQSSLPIENLKVGRLNYGQLLGIFGIPLKVPPVTSLCEAGTYTPFKFAQLKSLSVALSIVPGQCSALWSLIYGAQETLEHLEGRYYDSISDKSQASLQQPGINSTGGQPQTFDRLRSLTLSTHIVRSTMRWMNPPEIIRWGLPPVVTFLETLMTHPMPKLRQLDLEIYIGEEMSVAADDLRDAGNMSLQITAGNPAWQNLDALLTSLVDTNPSIAITMTLLQFFFVKKVDIVDAEIMLGSKYAKRRAEGDWFGVDECLPHLFAKSKVELRVLPVLSDKDMITYLRSV